MKTRQVVNSTAYLLSLLEPVLYGDIFDYPLTLEEVHTFCPLLLSRKDLEKEFKKNQRLREILSFDNGYFVLKGREKLAGLREERKLHSQEAWKAARKVIFFVKYVPFVKGILVTGSLAVNNARGKDDLDFLVLTEANRIWSVFFVLGVLQRFLLGRFLCPNYYLSIDHLRLTRQSYYLAREAIQARIVSGMDSCLRFYRENSWILGFFPNAEKEVAEKQEKSGTMERGGIGKAISAVAEWLLGGVLGNWLEKGFKRLLKHRLFVHHGKFHQAVPDEVLKKAMNEIELRFHALGHEKTIERELKERKNRVLALLSRE